MARRQRETLPKERLSPSEWQLMRICWSLGRCTVREVLREDLKTHIRDYRTILTFMTRMANKGWLEVEKQGNTNYYTPTVAVGKAVEVEIERFLHEVVGQRPEHLKMVETALTRLRSRRGRKS